MENAILVITTHGILRECSMTSIERATVPDDLNIVAIEATPCGVVNLLDDEDLDVMDDIISSFKIRERTLRSRNPKDDLIQSAIKIKKILLDMTKRSHEESIGSEDVERSDFAHSNLYNIYDYNITSPNEKEFLVYQKDLTPAIHLYNWKITLLIKGDEGEVVNINLLDLCFRLRSHKKKEEGVKLSFILDCIKTNFPNLENLLILDLSCNNLDNEECYMKDKHGEDIADEDGSLIVDPRMMRRVKKESTKNRLQSLITDSDKSKKGKGKKGKGKKGRFRYTRRKRK